MQANRDNAWLDTIESQISELSISIIARRLDLIEDLENLYDNELKNNHLTKHLKKHWAHTKEIGLKNMLICVIK